MVVLRCGVPKRRIILTRTFPAEPLFAEVLLRFNSDAHHVMPNPTAVTADHGTAFFIRSTTDAAGLIIV